MFMLAPAFFSVLFAGRSFFFLLWNMFWFWTLSNVAEIAFDSPQARTVGVFFAIVYLWRALLKPQTSQKIIFENMSFRSRKNTYGPTEPKRQTIDLSDRNPSNGNPANEVIDADFTVTR